MKKFLARLSAVALVAACWSGMVLAGSQSFALPQHGTLLLNVPAGWKSALKQPDGGLPSTIEFGAPSVRVAVQQGVEAAVHHS